MGASTKKTALLNKKITYDEKEMIYRCTYKGCNATFAKRRLGRRHYMFVHLNYA